MSAERLRLFVTCWMFVEWSRLCVFLSFASEIREYCNMEKFNASCDEDSVIVMDYAFYGRQRVGRCITHTDTPVKCGVDVLTITDSQCSGRRRCTLRLPDDEMYKMNACGETWSHLYAAYSCIPVAMIASGARCDTGVPISGQVGFLTSVRQATRPSPPASLHCRWNISVAAGRTINVTLFDFGVNHRLRTVADSRHRSRSGLSSECQKYAVVHERVGGVKRQEIICSGSVRTRAVYLSESNSIVVETFGGATLDDDDVTGDVTTTHHRTSRFLLKYQAVGCEDPALPADVTFRRDGNRGVMTCNDKSTILQYVVCEDNRWIGDIPNCSDEASDSISQESLWPGDSLGMPTKYESLWPGDSLGMPTTYGLLLVIVLGVLLGVAVGALMLLPVLAYFKRRDRRLQQRTKDEMTRMYRGAADIGVDDYHVTMSPDTPVISKFLPLNSTDDSSAPIVAQYDTAGRLTDVQPFTSCTGWHPALSVVDPGSAGTPTTCYQPSTAVRLAAPSGGGGWQLRRHGDQEHEYELPK